MEVRTYHVTAEMAGFSRRRSTLRVLYLAGLFATIHFLLGFVWHGSGASSVIGNLIQSMVTGVLFALVFFFAFLKPNMNYDLIVSDESISAVHPWFDRGVRKGEVRTVVETAGNALTPAALRLSKFRRIGTFLWGCVWIPRALPEYESIKALAESWKK